MQFLIQAEWVEQEAEEQDIKISDKEIERALEDQKKQAFPNDKQYEEFLASSGMTEEDVLFRVKLSQLQQKLTEKVTERRQEGVRRGHRGVLREEQEALRPAGAP